MAVGSKAKPAGGQRLRQVPAVTRAIAILRLLGRSEQPLGVNQVARELGLIPSTCLHILRILLDEGLVDCDPDTKRYTIGLGILPLARNAIRKGSFSAVVQPHLDALSQRFGITAIGVELVDLDHMVVVALSRVTMPFRLQVDIGSRFPALISATGRCLAAFSPVPEAEIARRFKQLKWDRPPSYAVWRAEVEQTRRQGYGLDVDTYIAGITILSVPLLNAAGAMAQGIVAVGVSERVRAQGTEEIARAMLAAKDDVAKHLYL